MIPIPTLPTDSLYKFLFVFGIITILSASYLETQVLVSNQKAFVIIDSLASEKSYKIDPLITSANKYLKSHQTSKAVKLLRDLKRSIDTFKLNDHTKSEIIKFEKQKKAKEDSINQVRKKEEGEYYLIKQKIRIADSINQTYHRLYDRVKVKQENSFPFLPEWFIIYLYVLGSLLTLFGGVSWYHKIQTKQDRILDLQLQQLELEINNKAKITGRYHFEPKNIPTKRAH